MEKEMKKLLLVAVSVGVFLLVTITVAIIVLTPKAQTERSAFSSSSPYSNGRTQNASDIMNNIPVQPVVIEETKSGTDETSSDIAEVDSDNGDSLTIQIPKPSTAAVPDNTEIPAQTVVIAPAPAAAPAVVKPAPAAPKPAPAPAPRPAAKPAQSRTINDFWVQTGAFSAMVRAEDAKELLASKGLVSIIENREVNGKTWYRVRLGPYTSEREAGYWLSLVKAIDGFADSQIRQTTRQRQTTAP